MLKNIIGAKILVPSLMAKIIFVLMLLSLAACSGGGGGGDSLSKRSVDPSIVPDDAIEVTQVQYVGDKLLVSGRNLERVTSVTLRGRDAPGTKQLYIGSKSFSAMEVWQATLPALEIISSKIFELVISTAHGQAIIPLTFILQDNAVTTVKILDGAVTNPKLAAGAVTLDKIGDVGASDGDVIKWDDVAGQWIVAADDAGVSGGGTVTSVTRGSGLINSGSSITTTGTIAVDTGTGPGKILKLDGAGDLDLHGIVEINSTSPSGGVLSFVDDAREFRVFNNGTFRIHDFTDSLDRLIIDGAGVVSISGDANISGDLTIAGMNFPSADGGNGQVLTTNGAGVLAWSTPLGGDITSVTAGTGLLGGGSSGDVTLSVDTGTTNGKILVVGAGDKIPVGVIPTAIDAANISSGVVSNTEFNFIDGVTAAIQTQFNNLTPVPAPGADSNFMVSNGTSWITESGATARASLGVSIGTQVQAWDDDLDDISGLTPVNNYFMVGDGTNWTAESSSSARTSLGLGTMATQNDSAVAITGGTAQLGTITAINQGQLQLREQVGNGTQYAALQAPGSITSSYTLTLPTGTGGAGQVMSTDGAGALQWSTDGGGDITGVTAGSGLTGGGASGDVTVSHADSSSVADVANGNGTILEDITFDTYGHVQTVTSYNLDNRYYTETESDSNFVNASGDTMTGELNMNAVAPIKFKDSDSSHFASIVSPGTITTSYVLTLPVDDGTAGQMLSSDGGGILSWVTPAIGDITGVTAGSGLTGGGTSGDVTVSHADSSSVADVANGNGTIVEDITFDTYGHVQTVTSYDLDNRYFTETESNTNFVNASGDTMTGLLRLQTSAVLEDPGAGSFAITMQAPTLAGDYTLTLPVTGGTNGQILTSSGSGVLVWSSAGAGDITSVTAGTGLTGGGVSGDVTLNVDVGTGNGQIAQVGAGDKLAVSIIPTGIPAASIGAGSVDNTELGYLDGATSSLQTQVGTKVNKAGDTMSGLLRLQTSAVFEDPGAGTFAMTIQSPILAANYVLTLPVDDGTSGQLLQTDGAGVLSWISGAAPTGSAGGDLTGTYPNPSIAAGVIVDADINASAAITATKIGGGTIDNTEFGYLNGTTSSLQTQLTGKVNKAGDTMTGNLVISQGNLELQNTDNTARELRLYEGAASGSNYVALKAWGGFPTNYTLTFPSAVPAANQVLLSDASGNFTWASTMPPGGSAGGDLTGTYPSPSIAAGVIVDADINASAAITATKIAGGTVDNTEFGYLNGVTAGIQSQVDLKLNKAGDTMTGNLVAPIMYDYNNTGYYVDPNSTSNLNTITASTISIGGSNVCLASGANCYLPAYKTNDVLGVGTSAAAASSGIRNTAFGHYSLFTNTTGTYNTAVGYSALSTSTSSDNTALGAMALYSLSSGAANTSIGTWSSYATTTGTSNIAIGPSALYGNTSGSYNIAIGQYANDATGSGSGNTSMGYSALGSATTSYYNTSIGYNSLASVSTGSYNVALGGSAGAGVTTGSSNVFIGYNAGPGVDVSNSLYIDNSQTSTPLIYGDFSANTITINGTLTSSTSMNTPTFYDSDNTGYYLNPASSSNLNTVAVASMTASGGVKVGATGTTCDASNYGVIKYESGSDTYFGCRSHGGTPTWMPINNNRYNGYATASVGGTRKLVFLSLPASTSITTNQEYSDYCESRGFEQNQNLSTGAVYTAAEMSSSADYYATNYCAYLGSGNSLAGSITNFKNYGLPVGTYLRVRDRGCGDYGGSFNFGQNTTDGLLVNSDTTYTYSADYYGAADYSAASPNSFTNDGVIVCQEKTAKKPIHGKWRVTTTRTGTGDWLWDAQDYNSDSGVFGWSAATNMITLYRSGAYQICYRLSHSGMTAGTGFWDYMYGGSAGTTQLQYHYHTAAGSYANSEACVTYVAATNDKIRMSSGSGGNRYTEGSTSYYTYMTIIKLD